MYFVNVIVKIFETCDTHVMQQGHKSQDGL